MHARTHTHPPSLKEWTRTIRLKAWDANAWIVRSAAPARMALAHMQMSVQHLATGPSISSRTINPSISPLPCMGATGHRHMKVVIKRCVCGCGCGCGCVCVWVGVLSLSWAANSSVLRGCVLWTICDGESPHPTPSSDSSRMGHLSDTLPTMTMQWAAVQSHASAGEICP